MTEAPKRIWVACDDGDEVPYVRADIADEMLAALKDIQTWAVHNSVGGVDRLLDIQDRADAAIAMTKPDVA